MTHGSLFSGIGGFDLAAQWCGWENMFQVEIDEFCRRVLRKNFPNVQQFKDIKEFDARPFRGRIDVLSGGFPCQPFSFAGKRAGKEDDRYLWPEMLRIIAEVRCRWVVGENVAGIIAMALDQVLSDLETEGYAAQAVVIPAAGVNAPHRRDRVWIVAYDSWTVGNIPISRKIKRRVPDENKQVTSQDSFNGRNRGRDNGNSGGSERALQIARPNRNASGAEKQGLEGRNTAWTGRSNGRTTEYSVGHKRKDKSEPWGESWYEVATRLCRVDARFPDRVDRLKSLGNAIVPQVAYEIFRAIDSLAPPYEVKR